jgi:hypothetical protein
MISRSTAPASTPEYRNDSGHRWSTLSVRRPPKWATAIAAAISGSNCRQENTSMKHLPENSSAWMVIELV